MKTLMHLAAAPKRASQPMKRPARTGVGQLIRPQRESADTLILRA